VKAAESASSDRSSFGELSTISVCSIDLVAIRRVYLIYVLNATSQRQAYIQVASRIERAFRSVSFKSHQPARAVTFFGMNAHDEHRNGVSSVSSHVGVHENGTLGRTVPPMSAAAILSETELPELTPTQAHRLGARIGGASLAAIAEKEVARNKPWLKRYGQPQSVKPPSRSSEER
jgi:hypothetical protein